MAIIITYDIPSKHVEFKKAMFKLGYEDQIPGTINCEVIYFPNTTLYHATKSAEAAREDAKITCKGLTVKLERCISTEWTNWAAICGEPFK
ncbi:hypothetical protein [Mucilaginibacter pedocola]|uniref:Uncharacterized protein n=1 Tax=Mucilaginibacter pedocola TaxID=1792845 RepID=A0A1S9P8Z2_9SPHI|nr:hypothetical protein [Mucilaginibacter pedocola]OOQ57415.1 hypothetical protein BC343_15060 [Mucilaginibacter pedocola]